MATSRLTGRTLALATVALVLACAKAAIGQPDRAVPRQAPTAARPSGFMPSAPVKGSSVGTFTQTGGGGGSSRIGTITASRGLSGSSIVTVQGDRRPVITRAGQSPVNRPQTAARPKTALASKPAKGTKPAAARAQPAVVVKRIVIGGEAPAPAPKEPAVAAAAPPPSDPRLREALQTVTPPPALGRNAFSLGTGSLGQISPP